MTASVEDARSGSNEFGTSIRHGMLSMPRCSAACSARQREYGPTAAAWIDHRPAAGGPAGTGGGQGAGDELPFEVGGVRRVAARPGGGQVHTTRRRVGSCTVAGDQVQTHM